MKTIKKQIKSVALVLTILILLQGCTIYQSVPVSIDHAVQKETKVKVMTKNSEKMKFKRIGVENGNYYGVKIVKGDIIKIPLDKESIISIKEKDKTLSNVATIGISVVSLFAVLCGIFYLANVAVWVGVFY